MKMRYRIKFAVDSMLLHSKSVLGNVVLCVIGLLLTGTILLLNTVHWKQRPVLEAAYQRGYKNIGAVMADENVECNMIEILQETEGIEASGYWNIGWCTLPMLMHFKDIQQSNVKQTASGLDEAFEITCVDVNAWDILYLPLEEGKKPSDYQIVDNMSLIYLGSAFQDAYEVGDTYYDEITKHNFLVAGFLEKGCQMPEGDIYCLNEFDFSPTHPLDYAVLEVNHFPSEYAIFSIKDGYTYDTVQQKIMNRCKELGITGEIYSLESVLDSVMISMKPVNEYAMQILLVIGITICIVMTCSQTMEIIMRKSEYGIFYANGMTSRDVLVIIFIENVIKVVISFVIAIPLLLCLSTVLCLSNYDDSYFLRTVLLESVSWKVALVAIGIAVVSSIIPIYTMHKYSPVMLIGGNRS